MRGNIPSDESEEEHLLRASVTCHKVDQISSFSPSVLCDGKPVSVRPGTGQEDWKVPRWEAESKVLVPLAAEW